jgi:hypothetical protein
VALRGFAGILSEIAFLQAPTSLGRMKNLYFVYFLAFGIKKPEYNDILAPFFN